MYSLGSESDGAWEWSQKPSSSSSSSSSSASLGCFVLLVEDLHQVLGHEVWFLWTAVITLQILHWRTNTTPQTIFSTCDVIYVCDTHRNTGRVCPHPCYTHWRSRERSDTHRTPPSVTHTHTHTLYKTKHLPDSTVHLVPNSQTEFMYLNKIQFYGGMLWYCMYIDVDLYWTWKHIFCLKIN